MATLLDIGGLGRLLGLPRDNPSSARRFRSTAVTVTLLDPTTPWQWCPQPANGAEMALLANVQSPVSLEVGETQRPADAGFFLHPHHTATVRAETRTSVLCAWIPWSALEELDDGNLGCLAISTPTPLLIGARGFASALIGPNAPTTMYTDYLVEKLLAEMVFGTILESGPTGVTSAREAATRETRPTDRARTLMLLRRADPDFGVEELAGELHMSTRQLQRTFAAEGASPADELRRMRVELATELLNDATYAPLSLRELATHAGFSNAAALRRAFAGVGLAIPTRRV